jgi:hypothetical protein
MKFITTIIVNTLAALSLAPPCVVALEKPTTFRNDADL